jgi:hypothetical protein
MRTVARAACLVPTALALGLAAGLRAQPPASPVDALSHHYESVGVSNCQASGTSSFSRLFKPYMQFAGVGDGTIFRNWDLAENYRISPAITAFDRGGDVLRR